MPVSETTFWWLIGGGVMTISTLATAVYFNRRRLNTLYQRLFGMDADKTDHGYIHRMDRKLDRLHEQMNRQHDEVYEKLREMNGEKDNMQADGGSDGSQ